MEQNAFVNIKIKKVNVTDQLILKYVPSIWIGFLFLFTATLIQCITLDGVYWRNTIVTMWFIYVDNKIQKV